MVGFGMVQLALAFGWRGSRTPPRGPGRTPRQHFNFKNFKETTNENTTAHCSVPILRCPGDEAGPSS